MKKLFSLNDTTKALQQAYVLLRNWRIVGEHDCHSMYVLMLIEQVLCVRLGKTKYKEWLQTPEFIDSTEDMDSLSIVKQGMEKKGDMKKETSCTCTTCLFYDLLTYSCHRHAPKPSKVTKASLWLCWPFTSPSEWCGEWKVNQGFNHESSFQRGYEAACRDKAKEEAVRRAEGKL
jgi:hypothetical protein